MFLFLLIFWIVSWVLILLFGFDYIVFVFIRLGNIFLIYIVFLVVVLVCIYGN